MSKCESSFSVWRVSSQAIASDSFRTRSARSEISSRLPMGVATTYRHPAPDSFGLVLVIPLTKVPRLLWACDLRFPSFEFANPFIRNQHEQRNTHQQIEQAHNADFPRGKLLRIGKYENEYRHIQDCSSCHHQRFLFGRQWRSGSHRTSRNSRRPAMRTNDGSLTHHISS